MTPYDQARYTQKEAQQSIRSAFKSLSRAADAADYPLTQAQSLQNCISHCAKALRLIVESQNNLATHYITTK